MPAAAALEGQRQEEHWGLLAASHAEGIDEKHSLQIQGETPPLSQADSDRGDS